MHAANVGWLHNFTFLQLHMNSFYIPTNMYEWPSLYCYFIEKFKHIPNMVKMQNPNLLNVPLSKMNIPHKIFFAVSSCIILYTSLKVFLRYWRSDSGPQDARPVLDHITRSQPSTHVFKKCTALTVNFLILWMFLKENNFGCC